MLLLNILITLHLLITLRTIITFFPSRDQNISRIHDPIGIRYFFQLRGVRVPYDKSGHDFIGTTSVICRCTQGIEDVNHFLFHALLTQPKGKP